MLQNQLTLEFPLEKDEATFCGKNRNVSSNQPVSKSRRRQPRIQRFVVKKEWRYITPTVCTLKEHGLLDICHGTSASKESLSWPISKSSSVSQESLYQDLIRHNSSFVFHLRPLHSN